MKLYQWFEGRYLQNKTLHDKLNYIFFFFFIIPITGFIYFGIKYHILTDRYVPFFFIGLLAFSFLGLTLLRKVFDDISGFSRSIANRIDLQFPGEKVQVHNDELNRLMQSFSVINQQVELLRQNLQRKTEESVILKDIADLCYITSDPDEILAIALERALDMTGSDMGSILILEEPENRYFRVQASIGLDQYLQIGERILFESSIAKYAVLNKTPLVVENIERDNRFGRANRSHYGTKSFICMPIKTSRSIIGVLTVSRRDNERTYSAHDADLLAPLISNVAFTYENLYLLGKTEQYHSHLRLMANILRIISSSFRNSELLHAFLSEIRHLFHFEAALVLLLDENRPDCLVVLDLLSAEPMPVSKGNQYVLKQGSAIERVIKQESTLVIADKDDLRLDVDIALFGGANAKSILLTPLRIDGQVKGILALAARESDAFEQMPKLIDWVANSLSLAIERNQLFADVVKRNKELDSLKQIGSALASSTFDIRQVLNYTMDMIRVIMNVEAGSLYLVKDKELQFAVAFNMDEEVGRKSHLKLGQGIPGYVAARGEPIILNDGQPSSHFFPEIHKGAELKPRSALCVPMISQGMVIGVIEVLNKIGADFDGNDQDLLQAIASSVSIAIENANLYNETVSMAENERGIRRMFQKFVPKEVLDKILHGSESGLERVEELKTLTLINIDLRGFSNIARSLGPQKTVSLLNHFFSVMGGIVFKHHGIVDKYLGDGFLAIFGAPVSSISDADNAISAALEMKAAMSTINSAIAQVMDVDLNIGISIHTGEVVVGNIGFEMKMDYTVIGDSVNDVFRLQDRTKPYPNSILVSEKTSRAVRHPLDLIELDESLGDLKIYQLMGIKNSCTSG
jgi:class 3 adenylate cyclase/putative methionine-R-sulfoxide reductase with GAF domain